MDRQIGRRDALKLATAGFITSSLGCAGNANKAGHPSSKRLTRAVSDEWSTRHDRIWLGAAYWANPMENWRIENGAVECLSRGGNRSVHSLLHQYIDPSKEFVVSVKLQRLEFAPNDGGAGLRMGARSDLNEYRSNCFVQKGFDAGILNNQLVLGEVTSELASSVAEREIELTLRGVPGSGESVELSLEARLVLSQESLGRVQTSVPAEQLLGNLALVSNFRVHESERSECRYRYRDWYIQGEAFSDNAEQHFGPILWTMYTLSDSRSEEGFVLKLSALTGPLGKKDNKQVELQLQKGKAWTTLAHADLDQDGWVATFRIANWDASRDAKFRVVYRESLRDGTEQVSTRDGIVKANPSSGKLRMAALTCQKDYAFPYEPVANNVVKLKPDLVFFSGDQLYESHGGFGIIRAPAEPAILNYLRKLYQFGWAFGEAMRNQPTVCLPDDHDVLQGNLWGEGGIAMQGIPMSRDNVDASGGYIEPVRMLNAVHRTQTGHHPDPYDPRPSARDLSVYYGDMVYGNVSFAILGDRQWKSGPERIGVIVGETGRGEKPEYINPAFDRKDLELLGERQELFLREWSKDWRGHALKAVLSQTVFAGIATHQPTPADYLKYDFDSSGWPASGRNRAIDAMRDSMALHICGDTHLATVSQYGVDNQRDSNWAFCTPAIAAGWQRWWAPDSIDLPHQNRPSHGLANTGEYLDSFGNKVYVYSAGNPKVPSSDHRYIHAHEKGSGFGFITFDTEALTYTMDAFRFLIDVSDGDSNNQFPGWPLTVHQRENRGENVIS